MAAFSGRLPIFIVMILLMSFGKQLAYSLITGEGYLGCFRDLADDRVLPSDILISQNMTSSYCIQFCMSSISANYIYAGVEFGRECFCGEASDNYARHGVGSSDDCDFRCAGDPIESCGGAEYIAIFTIHVETVMTTPAVVSTKEVDEVTSQLSSEMTSNTRDAVTSSPLTTPVSTPTSLQQTVDVVHVETVETTPAVVSTEVTINTKDAVTSSPLTTHLSTPTTLQQTGHGSCVGVAVGEGVVIILLIATIIVLVMYIVRNRRMKKDSHSQNSNDMTLVLASSSPDKDTGIYHGIQDIRTPVPSLSPAGGSHYSSNIYNQTLGHATDPADTGILTESTHYSTRIEKD